MEPLSTMNSKVECPTIPADLSTFWSLYPRQFLDLCTTHLSFHIDIPPQYLHSQVYPGRSFIPWTQSSESCLGSSGETMSARITRLFLSSTRSGKSHIGKRESKSVVLTESLLENLRRMVEFLRKPDNIRLEGLFRISGSYTRQQQLKTLLLADSELLSTSQLAQFGVHEVAVTFKKILSMFEEPLLTWKLTEMFLQVAELSRDITPEDLGLGSTETVHQSSFFSPPPSTGSRPPSLSLEKQIRCAQIMCILLPPSHRSLLHNTLSLLDDVTRCQENKMSAHSLAIAFAPNLIRTTASELKRRLPLFIKLIMFLIPNFEKLFQMPACIVRDVDLNLDHFRLYGDAAFEDELPLLTAVNFTHRPLSRPPSESERPLGGGGYHQRTPVKRAPTPKKTACCCYCHTEMAHMSHGRLNRDFPSHQRTSAETHRSVTELCEHVRQLPESTKIRKRFFRRLRRQPESSILSPLSSITTSQTKINNMCIKKRIFTRSHTRLPLFEKENETTLVSWSPLKCSPPARERQFLSKTKPSSLSMPKLLPSVLSMSSSNLRSVHPMATITTSNLPLLRQSKMPLRKPIRETAL